MGLYTHCCRAVCAYVGFTVALQLIGFAICAGTYYENHEEDFKHAQAVVHKYQSGTKIAFQKTKFAIDEGVNMVNQLETVTNKDKQAFPAWIKKGIDTHKTKSFFTGQSQLSREKLQQWKPGDLATVDITAKSKDGKESTIKFTYEPIKLVKVANTADAKLDDPSQFVELHIKNFNGIYQKKYASSLCVLVDQSKEGKWALKEKDALGGFGCNANETFNPVKTYNDLPPWEKKAPSNYDNNAHKHVQLPVEVRYAREPTTYLTRHYTVFGSVKSYVYLHPLLILGISSLAFFCVCFACRGHRRQRHHAHLPTIITKNNQPLPTHPIQTQNMYAGEDEKEEEV